MNLLPPSQRLGVADNTQKRLDTGIYYIIMYMEAEKPFGDDNITRFQYLTAPYVAGDNIEKFMINFYFSTIGSHQHQSKLNRRLRSQQR